MIPYIESQGKQFVSPDNGLRCNDPGNTQINLGKRCDINGVFFGGSRNLSGRSGLALGLLDLDHGLDLGEFNTLNERLKGRNRVTFKLGIVVCPSQWLDCEKGLGALSETGQNGL